jgi:hypothetical protein
VDSSNGAAVADNMCCPKKEVELPAKAKLPSKQRIADRLARVLKAAAVRLEEKRLEGRHPYQPRPSSYLAASDSRHDIDSYFNSLASNTPATRALPAKAANDDLSKFFASLDQGTLDGLAPKVSQELPQPQIIRIDSGLIQAAASQLANGLRAGIRQRASAERAAKFSGWQETSEGMRRSPRAPVMC